MDIRFVKLEGDRLIIGTLHGITDVEFSTIISGEIKISRHEFIMPSDCLINGSGDKFMFVVDGNKAQLERLQNAVIHLQQFITKDPFQK